MVQFFHDSLCWQFFTLGGTPKQSRTHAKTNFDENGSQISNSNFCKTTNSIFYIKGSIGNFVKMKHSSMEKRVFSVSDSQKLQKLLLVLKDIGIKNSYFSRANGSAFSIEVLVDRSQPVERYSNWTYLISAHAIYDPRSGEWSGFQGSLVEIQTHRLQEFFRQFLLIRSQWQQLFSRNFVKMTRFLSYQYLLPNYMKLTAEQLCLQFNF